MIAKVHRYATEAKRADVEPRRRNIFAAHYCDLAEAVSHSWWTHLPPFADVLEIREVADVIEDDVWTHVSKDSFSWISIYELVSDWEDDVKTTLLSEMIAHNVCTWDDARTSPEEQLNRLLAVFHCGNEECNALLFGWEDVQMHKCRYLERGSNEVLPNSPADVLLKTIPSPKPFATYAAAARTVLLNLPRKARKDLPDRDVHIATVADMDNSRRSFHCRASRSYPSDFADRTFNWRQHVCCFTLASVIASLTILPRFRSVWRWQKAEL